MCGIAGLIDFRGRPVAPEALEAAQAALAHRGPDDRGVWTGPAGDWAVGLAHTRLAVLDPSPAGHQPFADPSDRYQIVYNGEIYNFRALRDELAGCYPFRTSCDTEALLAALAAWGPAALDRCNGMWAFACLDRREPGLCVARDRFGIKPLYYAVGPGTERPAWFAFASEVRALCPLLDARDVTLEIDPAALQCYLALGFIPHPLTIYRQVRKLPPGHRLDITPAGVREPVRYYRLPARPAPPADYVEAQARLRHAIRGAVGARMIADVPLGAFLSGGIDSAVIVAELAELATGPVKTFSIGYADQPRYDETRYARLVADRYATEHHELKLTAADVLDAIPPMLDHLAEPFADSSLIPTALVSRHAVGTVTVALSGDGGDELFAGYWRYRGHQYWEAYRRIPHPIRRWVVEPAIRVAPVGKSMRWLDRLRQARKLLRARSDDAFERHAAWAQIADADSLAALSRPLGAPPGDLAATLRAAARDLAPDADAREPLDAVLLGDLAFGLPADMLAKIDTASMAHSLEVRVPLLDPAVVELAAGLPLEFKLRDGRAKAVLRDAYADRLPGAILNRAKMGFEVPVGEFLRGPMREMFLDTVRPDVLGELGLDSAVVDALWRDHLRFRQERSDLLFALLTLCRWRRNFPAGAGPARRRA
jgi:asparagine synthase (glutamine-hydrolysing)